MYLLSFKKIFTSDHAALKHYYTISKLEHPQHSYFYMTVTHIDISIQCIQLCEKNWLKVV